MVFVIMSTQRCSVNKKSGHTWLLFVQTYCGRSGGAVAATPTMRTRDESMLAIDTAGAAFAKGSSGFRGTETIS